MKNSKLIWGAVIVLLIAGVFVLFQEKEVENLGATITEVPAIVKTKTGDYSHFRFKNNSTGAIEIVVTTKTEYDKLGIKDAINPTLAGHTFVGASNNELFSTSSPVLKDNEYYVVGVDEASSTIIRIKEGGKGEETVLKSSIPSLSL